MTDNTVTEEEAKEKEDTVFQLDIVEWEGKIHCVYLNDFRIAGGKPWGGGETVKSFQVKESDLERARKS